jgi:hypothetical protein
MASVIYNSFLDDEARALIDLDAGTNIGVMLVTSSYVENVDTHLDRADITNEVSGTGYTAGGKTALTATVVKNTGSDNVVITLPSTSWTTATITAAGAVYFLDTGVAANDRLIAYNDFGGDVSSTAATFTLNSSTITKTNNSAS